MGAARVDIEPGGASENLKPGGEIENTQGAVDLFGLIGQFMRSSAPASPATPPSATKSPGA
jgi:phospholipid/cholesterol/gamma-HCH transport system substrate-binding protein